MFLHMETIFLNFLCSNPQQLWPLSARKKRELGGPVLAQQESASSAQRGLKPLA